MVTLLQKADLSALDFTNDNSNAAGGIAVRTAAGSAVAAAIATALGSIPTATTSLEGTTMLSGSGQYPQLANNTVAATPAYVNSAIVAALGALPSDVFFQSAAYNAATDTLNITLNDSTVVPVAFGGLVADAVAAAIADVQANGIPVTANDGVTVLGYMIAP